MKDEYEPLPLETLPNEDRQLFFVIGGCLLAAVVAVVMTVVLS